ncbi:MAG: hypothetical protein A3A61_01950 [Candidatus Woykebacteria bacterium RIFCSPLOWO2_01_FULL_43_14]|uniref:Heat-inducible transcription repressor HrcA n=2 Tax=Candidatus Woykeibacteriota TaxID=1817899 RepID=A0A1G1WVV0_9BACT|nr:MAG: hypothetical protein A3J50_00040 [Candidatus Woykebacteria bacterium RIFCSPHIGHO2_02_FULL_43_16b]OGY31825.1 MAG: hypothetical protein A3A61_01950 [Candidatus Woykebacteria bacterium RIFCSPLOWO2_01_FULL_43_14]
MMDLSDRLQEILRAIVEEYISSSEPVGSETIVKKYNIGVSPATVRNVMVSLTREGYLNQPHTSAGRIPSCQGIKLYIDTLMKENQLSVRDEVTIKEYLWEERYNLNKLLRNSVHQLADRSKTLSVIATDSGDVYFAGLSHILDLPEFYDIDLTKSVLSLIDEVSTLEEILNRTVGQDDVHVLFGEELGIENLAPCSFIFAHFGSGEKSGSVGLIGPSRLPYARLIPTVRYFSNLLTDITGSW